MFLNYQIHTKDSEELSPCWAQGISKKFISGKTQIRISGHITILPLIILARYK